MTKPKKGMAYYKSLGMTKSVVIPMTEGLYEKLVSFARKEERTLQATARRILERVLKA